MNLKKQVKTITGKTKDFIVLMRPNAWFVTVFSLSIGAVFALSNTALATETWLKFLFLCFAFTPFIAGGLYVLNDVNDRELDRKNPDKANRPIASGRVTPIQGIVFSFVLLSIGCFLALQISFLHFIFALTLIFLQLIYSMPPIRLKESSVDFLFSGPLNHIVRFAAAWAIFLSLASLPIVSLAGLFLLYCSAYIYYKLVDMELTPKKSIARSKNIQKYLDLITLIGITLIFTSILLNEISSLFIVCPIFLTLVFLLQKIIPNPKRMPALRSMFYGYGHFGLVLGTICLWMLVIIF